MDLPSDKEKVRKTVSLTHRQIGATGLIGLAVALAPYLKETFVTRDEQKVVAVQMEQMSKELAELRVSVDANTIRILDQIKESERRTGKNEDRLERRVDGLEAALRLKSLRGG